MDVVIVDDNPVNLTVMEHLVSRVDGAVPRSFRGAEQGLASCQSHDPDLVILDYQMPDIDGLQFIERIRALLASREPLGGLSEAASERPK